MNATPTSASDEPNRAWARALIEELIFGGVGHICVSPGSRSTPLTLAAAEHAAPGGATTGVATTGGATTSGAIGLSVHYDERSAAFFALGYARATARPALCICTSGTAAANYLPAVIEAHYSRAPLILLTADRPPELRDTGAWQVIDQTKLYGVYTRWYTELGLPSSAPDQLRYARGVAARAAAVSLGRPPGPVHVNVPLREPFPPWDTADDAPARPGPTTHATTTSAPESALDALAERIRARPRGLILAGRLNRPPTDGYATAVARLAAASGYPMLAEPTGGVRFGPHDRSHVITGYDAFMRDSAWSDDPENAPDLILRIGASFTWRTVSDVLARFPDAHTVVVDPDGAWDDPARLATERFEVEPEALCAGLAERLEAELPDAESPGSEPSDAERRGIESPASDSPDADQLGAEAQDAQPSHASRRAAASAWRQRWSAAAERAADVRRRALDSPSQLGSATSAWVSEAVIDAIGDRRGLIWVANSMAVRDIDTFTGPRPEPITVLAARGAAGIDGTISQALGAARGWQSAGPGERESGRSRPAVLITGDLAFLHDLNGLAAQLPVGPQLVIVVVDDAGGGIFEYLPVASGERASFERYFATPPPVDIEAACAAFGVPCETVRTADGVVAALSAAIGAGGTRVIRIPIDRASNTEWHRAYWRAVAARGEGIADRDHSADRDGIAELDRIAQPADVADRADIADLDGGAPIEGSRPPITPLHVERLDILSTPAIAPPLILLHGFTGDAGTWHPFAGALGQEWHAAGDAGRAMFAPDLVGHGGSPEPGSDAAHAIPAQIDSLVAALDALGVGRAIWCGYSMGGRIALSLAVTHPERAAGLVLIGASAGIEDPRERSERRAADRKAAEALVEDGIEAFVERWMAHPLFATQAALGHAHLERMRAQRLRNRPESLARSLRAAGAGAMTPVHGALGALDMPALVVAGALDTKYVAISAELAERMPNARRALIEGAGHAVHLEAPEALARVVAAFVRDIEGG